MELDALSSLAEEALPTVRFARATFGAWLERHEVGKVLLAAPAPSDVDREAMRARVSELWLACAIGSGDAAAVRVFEQRYIAPLDTTLARMRLGDAELDEVKQLVRAKLLVREPNGAARIEEYAGQGRMAGLVQVVATREALTLIRRGRREEGRPDEDSEMDLAGPMEPGLEALKAKYRAAFRAAFADAVATLEPKERNLLRMHLLGGVTLEQLATVHGVHRASIVRWLKDARDAVLERTRAALGKTLGVRADELASLHALAESRLDASIERLLMTNADDKDQAAKQDQ